MTSHGAINPICEHPLRRVLHNELHARPSLYFDGDRDVWHIAYTGASGAPATPPALSLTSDDTKEPSATHKIVSFGGGQLKWERHTEFLTLTLVTEAANRPTPPIELLQICQQIDGEMIAAIRIKVRAGEAPEDRPGRESVASQVGGGDAEVHSNFRLSDAGFVEMHLYNRNLNAYRTGRMVRRLLEIETYRMMALLAMPVAQEAIQQLASFDGRLDTILVTMRSSPKVDNALLDDVTKLSSDVLNISTIARHRFGATKACAELVASRLSELREERVEQRQRLGTFLDRRFRPALRTVQSAERRLDELAQRVSLAGDLLRTTIQVQLEHQNAALLASMEERTKAQVHIQQAVEGFSVIAISYYGIGLLKICLESVSGLGLDVHTTKAILLGAIPVSLWAVWRTVRHVRRQITSHTHASSIEP